MKTTLKGKVLSFLIILLAGAVILSHGCAASGTPLPSVSKEGNPKLDSALNDLFKAYQEGNLAEYATQHAISLENGKVRVIVECEPNKLDSIAQQISTLGIVEGRYQDFLQVLVQPANLNKIASIEGIKIIRLPLPVVPVGG